MTKANQSTVKQSTALVPVITDTNSENNIPNSPDLKELAREAIQALTQSDKFKGKANAIMAYVISQAWYGKTFECVVSYKDGAKKLNSFDLNDIVEQEGIVQADGKKDTKLNIARLNAVALDLFGVTGEIDDKSNLIGGKRFNASQLATFNRACNLIHNLIKLNVRLDSQVMLDENKILCVPYRIFTKKPEAKYQTRLAVYETMKDKIVPILSFEDLERNVFDAMPDKKKKGAKSRKASPAEIFTESLHNTIKTTKLLTEDVRAKKEVIGPTLKKDLMAAMLAIQGLFKMEEQVEKEAQEEETKAKTKKVA